MRAKIPSLVVQSSAGQVSPNTNPSAQQLYSAAQLFAPTPSRPSHRAFLSKSFSILGFQPQDTQLTWSTEKLPFVYCRAVLAKE